MGATFREICGWIASPSSGLLCLNFAIVNGTCHLSQFLDFCANFLPRKFPAIRYNMHPIVGGVCWLMTSYGESPLVVAAGFIGKLKIEIPLTRIQSRAWVVHIDQVYLVAVPSQLTEVRTSCAVEPLYRGHPCYPSLLFPLSPVLPPHPLYVPSPSTMKRRKKQGCRNRNRGNWPSLRSSGG